MPYTSRRFSDADLAVGIPPFIHRQVEPFAAFARGWSSKEDTMEQSDTGEPLDTTLASGAFDTLYPVTLYARVWSDQVWPMIQTILRSGIGSRVEAAISETAVVRYLALGIEVYSQLLAVLHTNRLAYHFDWTKMSPFTPDIPAAAFARANSLKASDVEVGDIWLPLIRRAESIIMFPEVALEIKRTMQPYLSLDMHPILTVPAVTIIDDTQDTSGTDDADAVATKIKGYLDFMDKTLANTQALLRTFIPFDLASIGPWNLSEYQTDPMTEAGHWNSGIQGISPFESDTTSADVEETTIEDDQTFLSPGSTTFTSGFEAGGLSFSFDSRYPQPIWGEVKRSCMYRYRVRKTGTSTHFERTLLSPHLVQKMYFVEDDGTLDTINQDDTAITRFFRYVNSKFYGSAVNYGVSKPGYLTSLIHLDAVERLMYQEVINNYDVPRLRNILGATTGASNRVVRELIMRIATEKYA